MLGGQAADLDFAWEASSLEVRIVDREFCAAIRLMQIDSNGVKRVTQGLHETVISPRTKKPNQIGWAKSLNLLG